MTQHPDNGLDSEELCMQLGVHFTNFSLPGGTSAIPAVLGDTARTAEQIGCTSFTLMDHWFQMEQLGGPEQPMLEGYTSLGYLAGQTERINLSLLVTGVTYRVPALLVKTVTTLDVLSRGRAMLGIGAAWYEREHRALGVPFPPVAERFERLEETLRVCRQMWSDDDGPFDGTHYQLAETICMPRPVRNPRPPILIGGMGEHKTLRLVAKYADATNLFMVGHDEIKRKLGILREHCDREGRDYDEIRKTIVGGDPVGDPDGYLRAMEGYAKLGIDLADVTPTGPDPAGYVSRLHAIVPRLGTLDAA
jgi:F420-dependent oxidoreductase-like protein